ncbi:thiol:disulfide interchange protein DsbA/DsbL [Haliea sp. AH-315-K21]|nr:thiol:disulfide interchange protein DsbA/DsbL [Haliea sp. AH-315-K21]
MCSTNKYLKLLTCLLFIFSTSITLAQPERYLAGRDYQLIEAPSSSNALGIVEVEEYFWYGCPGCFQFDFILTDWLETLPQEVNFTRFPAIWSAQHEVHAKAYYTAFQLGVLESLHEKIFEAMHLEGLRFRNESELAGFFEKNNISNEQFTSAYNSFTVNTAINRAEKKSQRLFSPQYTEHGSQW